MKRSNAWLLLVIVCLQSTIQPGATQDLEQIERIIQFACRMLEPARQCLTYMPEFIQTRMQELFEAVGTNLDLAGVHICQPGAEKRNNVTTFIKDKMETANAAERNGTKKPQLSVNQVLSGTSFLSCIGRVLNNLPPATPPPTDEKENPISKEIEP